MSRKIENIKIETQPQKTDQSAEIMFVYGGLEYCDIAKKQNSKNSRMRRNLHPPGNRKIENKTQKTDQIIEIKFRGNRKIAKLKTQAPEMIRSV